jgi:hypothetical protein
MRAAAMAGMVAAQGPSTMAPLTNEEKAEARALNDLTQAFLQKGMQCSFGPHGPYGKSYRWAAKFFEVPKKSSYEAELAISWIPDKFFPSSNDGMWTRWNKLVRMAARKPEVEAVVKKDDVKTAEIAEAILAVHPNQLQFFRKMVSEKYDGTNKDLDQTDKTLDKLISDLKDMKDKADMDSPKIGRADIPGSYDDLRILAIMHYLAAKQLKTCTNEEPQYTGLGAKFVELGDLFMALARVKQHHVAAQLTHTAEARFGMIVPPLVKNEKTRTEGLMRTLLAHYKRTLLDDRSLTAWYLRTPDAGKVICDFKDPNKAGAMVYFLPNHPGFATTAMSGNHDPLTAFAKYARAGAMLCGYKLDDKPTQPTQKKKIIKKRRVIRRRVVRRRPRPKPKKGAKVINPWD